MDSGTAPLLAMQPPPVDPTLLPPQAQPADGTAPVIKRRAPIACRRCRRMRSKCHHDKARPPCKACEEAGLGAEDCIFPVRGQPDHDRDYRHPRMRAEKTNKRDPAKVRRDILEAPIINSPLSAGRQTKGVDEWDFLPPLPEVIDAVNQFTRLYFQLGFIPKQIFPERLKKDHRSVSVFLLLSILSISARFTPSIIQRFGDGMKGAEMFMDRASVVALSELYREPSLERCQAFYLLSIAQQGSGWKNRSFINLGIAMRMAALMRLHREETYTLTNPTKELIVRAESARRTLWMLHSQDNLHSGPSSPVSLAASDITALLPGNEEDFAKGVEPKSRAALEDTPPAIENPRLISDPNRSLFATLIQTHYFWGRVSRRAVSRDASSRPWEPTSEYAVVQKRLEAWEQGLPRDHIWSSFALKGYKTEGQDLAYLSVTMVTRLCNIVIRKAYLHYMIHIEQSEPSLRGFWSNMALEMFKNVRELYQQIDTQFIDRAPDEHLGAQIAAFCVFSCAHMAIYLTKYPNICPDPTIVQDGPMMVQRCMAILAEAQNVWPLASRWIEGLEKFVNDNKGVVTGLEGSMADGRDPVPHALQPSVSPTKATPQQTEIGQGEQKAILPAEPHQQRHHSITPNANIAPAPPQPSPMMYIDPQMRAQHAHPQTQPHPPQAIAAMPPQGHPQHPQHPQPVGARPTTDGLGLLIEAFDTHQGGGAMGGPSGPAYDPSMAGQHAEYYPHPGAGLAGGDGYENELQFYIDGAPNMQNWVGNGGMYGY